MIQIKWRIWRKVAYLLLVAVVIALVTIYWSVLADIWREQALTLIGAVVIMICGAFVQAGNFLVFLHTPSRPRLWKFVQVWSVSALANYLAPLQPGIAVRVAWLAKHDVNISTSLLATWRQLVVSVWISLAGLAVGLLLTGDPHWHWPALLLALAWLAMFSLRGLWLTWLSRIERPAWLVQRKELLHRAAAGIALSGVAGVVMQYVLGTLLLYWVYSRFGASIGVGQALIITCLVYVASMVALLPGNLGVTEAIYMLGGHGFGLSVGEAGALALLLRVSHITCNGLLTLCGAMAPRDPGDKQVNVS